MSAGKNPNEDALQTVPERTPLFSWGAVATSAYLFGIGILALNFDKSLLDLDPNELGDFLAGAFSPLAFLWLVLGFVQQGQELRIQAVELNNSVEQSRQLVQVTRDQLELDRETAREAGARASLELSPKLRVLPQGNSSSAGNRTFHYLITNVGGDGIDLECDLVWDDGSQTQWFKKARFAKGDEIRPSFGTPSREERRGKIEFRFKNLVGVESILTSLVWFDGMQIEVDEVPSPIAPEIVE
ncbi:hypothetical protein [Erythrobacter ani]|uniref:Uncharacterized protein n=1 Tax=Erythrobacter ani TaxID=2827235 RepID=A0ABS6SI05_9SPHN|nr:hypothetical protein [Erythrobacter ani]MBV7264616.1 hypothetical protein [Erythrobacter ani]